MNRRSLFKAFAWIAGAPKAAEPLPMKPITATAARVYEVSSTGPIGLTPEEFEKFIRDGTVTVFPPRRNFKITGL